MINTVATVGFSSLWAGGWLIAQSAPMSDYAIPATIAALIGAAGTSVTGLFGYLKWRDEWKLKKQGEDRIDRNLQSQVTILTEKLEFQSRELEQSRQTNAALNQLVLKQVVPGINANAAGVQDLANRTGAGLGVPSSPMIEPSEVEDAR